MPRKPGISEPLVERLAQGTRFAPGATVRRAVERAEALAHELDPKATYPEDFVAYRLLAYRPDTPSTMTATGLQILGSLPGLIDRWSAQAHYTMDELGEAGGVEAAELAERWRVSRKTLGRWATLGLLPRRAKDARGVMRTVYMPEMVAWFRAAHAADLARAAAFSRITDEEARSMIRRAQAYRRKLGWPPTRAARRLAGRFGRSVEAVRQVLARDAGDAPHTPTPDERTRRVMFRANRLGFDPGVLASRFGCSRAAAQRGINLIRLRHLRAAVQPVPSRGDPSTWARHPALSHAVVQTNLARPGVTDLAGFFAAARVRTPASPREEHLLLEGIWALRGAASGIVASVRGLNPEAQKLDEAETALRWASRLKAELMRRQLALLVETADSALGVPIESLPGARADEARLCLLHALGLCIDHADPATSGRIAAPAGLAMATAAGRLVRDAAPAKTRALSHLPSGIDIPDWTSRVNAWQARLEPDPRIRPRLILLGEPDQAVIRARYGFSGQRPRTLSETAELLGISRVSVPGIERRALRRALASARGADTSGSRQT